MNGTRTTACRHPLYQAADELKRAFLAAGFELVDDGVAPELLRVESRPAIWDAPAEIFAWEDDPICVAYGDSRLQLRTRMLSAQLHSLQRPSPFRVLAFGRVYRKEPPGAMSSPMRHRLEGLVVERSLALADWKMLWGQIAVALYGAGADVRFRPCGMAAYAVDMQDPAHKDNPDEGWFNLAYTGPATTETLKSCGVDPAVHTGWAFVIDVEQFTMIRFSIREMGTLFENDVRFLARFRDNTTAFVGNAPEDLIGETLRLRGYYEVAPLPFYPEGSYKKANMVYAVDTLRDHFAVSDPVCEDMAILRTVLTIGTEATMAFNYSRSNTATRTYEVSHIYQPSRAEQLCISMAAYGEDVCSDSFRADVQAVLDTLGVEGAVVVPTDQAPAFDPKECMILCDRSGFIGSVLGRVHEIAQKNYGIGVPVYMAQMNLAPLVERSNNTTWKGK